MNEPSRILPNQNSHDDGVKCHAQEQPATVKKKNSLSQIFLDHLSTDTSLFFNKLEEDNIFLIYNSTFRANMHRYLII